MPGKKFGRVAAEVYRHEGDEYIDLFAAMVVASHRDIERLEKKRRQGLKPTRDEIRAADEGIQFLSTLRDATSGIY